jgi:hypothetical protein
VTGQVTEVKTHNYQDGQNLKYMINNVSVTSNRDTEDNQAVRVFNWGKFGERDLEILGSSISGILSPYSGVDASESYDVHVKLHRYSQTITNSSYASLVVVDWALVKSGELIHDEVFFAGHDMELNIFLGKTLGVAKNTTNKAIVNRIVNKVVNTLSENTINPKLSETHVYNTAEELIKVLPRQMTSVGMIFVETGVAVITMGSRTESTNFDNRAHFTKVNWLNEIKSL